MPEADESPHRDFEAKMQEAIKQHQFAEYDRLYRGSSRVGGVLFGSSQSWWGTEDALRRLGRAMRVAARNWGTSLGLIAPEQINPSDANLFVSNAFEYYAAARFAVRVQLVGVCGNITHHAVEMFLKGGLARYRTLSELRAITTLADF
jgi:hypothetical protein